MPLIAMRNTLRIGPAATASSCCCCGPVIPSGDGARISVGSRLAIRNPLRIGPGATRKIAGWPTERPKAVPLPARLLQAEGKY
jgi:hypothetical protein